MDNTDTGAVTRCSTNGYLVTSEDVLKTFPQAQEVQSLVELNDTRRRGVYYFRNSESAMVKIVGSCPNWENGQCRLGEGCVGIGRERR